MTVEYQTIDGSVICKLSGALSIWEAAATWKEISPLLSSKDPLELNLSDVEQCDGSGIQILCQIQRMIEKDQGRITISGLSESVQSAMHQAGLNQEAFETHLEGKE